MSGVLTPAWLVICAVLVSAGIGKARPDRTRSAQAGIRRLTGAGARLIGGGEIMLGVAAAWAPVPMRAAAVAAAYGVFAVVLLRQLRGGDARGCGCFGSASRAPAQPLQVGLNGACALVGIGAVVGHPHGISWLAKQPLLVMAPVGAGLAVALIGVITAFTVLADAWQASTRRRCWP